MVRIALAVAVILTLAFRSKRADARSAAARSAAVRNAAARTAAAGSAAAGRAGAPGAEAMLEACRPDLAQFCSQVRPGGGRIRSLA
jgi:hypothetical protein